MKKYTRTYKTTKKKSSKKKNTISQMQGLVILIVLLAVSVLFAYFYTNYRRVIIIPDGCGTFATREWDLNYYECAEGSDQYEVDKLWHQEGTQDEKGFQKLYGRYLIACTDTFGKVGDKIDFYMSDGTVLECIIYDLKSQEKAFYDQNPADKWGHHHGQVVMEFVGAYTIGTNPYKALGLRYEHTVKAIRYGNILK